MSRQEIYAWTSMLTTLVVAGYYFITVGVWPEVFEGYIDHFTGLLGELIVLAVAVEILLGIAKYFKIGELEQDARDLFIEARSYRAAYTVVLFGLAILVVNTLVYDVFWSAILRVDIIQSYLLLHLIVGLGLVASLTRSTTQLLYYRGILKSREINWLSI